MPLRKHQYKFFYYNVYDKANVRICLIGNIYHSRQACPANRITYGLVPEQIVTEKYNWVFLNGGRSLQLKRNSTFSVEILDHRSPWATLIPIPRLVTSDPGPVIPYPTLFLAFDLCSHIPCFATLSLSLQSVLQYRRWQGCSGGVPMKL